MAQSDDEIPDLFPAQRRQGQAAAPSPSGGERPARHDVLVSPQAPSRRAPSLAPSPSLAPPPLRIADTPSSDGLEIDYEDQSSLAERGTVVVGTPEDALEFDPSSIRRPTAEEYLQGRAASRLIPPSPKDVPQVGELELDFRPFELEPSSSIPPAPSPSMAPPGSMAAPRSMAPSPSMVPPGSVAAPRSMAPSPSMAPPGSIAPRGSLPPSVATASGVSQYPRGSAASSVSHYPPASMPISRVPQDLAMNFPGLGGEVELGDGLDDLDFGGAALAQMNVEVKAPEVDDVPWPLARTPHPDEIDFDEEEIIALSGFGSAPSGFFSAPLYFLRVSLSRKNIEQLCRSTGRSLADAERLRDEKLASIAETKRLELQKNDRFRALYSTLDRHDQIIAARRQALGTADAEGADELRRIQAQLETLGRERIFRESRRNDQKRVVDQHQRELERARAVVRRTEIELRNLEERRLQGVDFGVVNYETRKNAQLTEKERAQIFINEAQSARQHLEHALEQAEDDLRRVVADFQGHEAQKEGLVLAYEGDLASRSRELDEAIKGRLNDLAHAARVIFELRGEVKVDVAARLDISAADDAVRVAFVEHGRARAALGSMDVEMYRLGRTMWIVFCVLILMGLAGSAVL